MKGKLRYVIAGGMLLFLGLVFAFAPGREQVFRAQSKKILENLLVEWRGDDPELDKPIPVSWQPRTTPVSEKLAAKWQASLRDRKVETGSGPPLVFSFDPRADAMHASLRVPTGETFTHTVADFRSILPPFVTILIAVLAGKTILALLVGVLLGAILHAGLAGGATHFATKYVWDNVVSDDFQLQILLFVLFLSMAVGIMTKAGGIEGLVELVRGYAKTARSSQLVTWFMGLLVFFDDYANTIVVGSTMRPLTDKLRVSREKLSYIVDSTAAPVAGIAVLSTWVAYEISTFASSLPEVTNASGEAYTTAQGFQIFLETIPYRFYCILTLCMVVIGIVTRREFGPMLRAERRARRTGQVIEDGATPLVGAALTETKTKEGAPALWWNGLLPILTLLGVTLWQIWQTGKVGITDESAELFTRLRQVLENADSTKAIYYGAASAAGLAGLLAIAQRILSPLETVSTATKSLGALFFAVVILVLAWAMGDVCKEDLGTAYYLVALTEDRLPPLLLPTLLFLLSCLIAFSIGSSWSTMAILLPNVVLLAHGFGEAHQPGFGPVLMVLAIGAVLEGSIFGDHCSPISDTTVLSSVACASDHLHHVRTQVPYALLVMVTSMLCGYLPVAFISPKIWPISLLAGITVITVFLLTFGRDPERED